MKKLILLLIISISSKAQPIERIYKVTRHLTTAEIKTGNSSPINVGLPFPGIGKAYEVVSASVRYNFNTVTFNCGDGSIYIHTENLAIINYQAATTSILNFPYGNYARAAVNSLDVQMVENKRLFLTIGDDSSIGDGSADVFINYRIIGQYVADAALIQDTIVTITSPQLLNIFTSPVTLIPSPGLTKTIEVVSMTDKLIFNTTAYAGHQTLIVTTATATDPQAVGTVLNQNANCKHLMINTAPGGQTQLLANQPLIATTQAGNPTTGDSSIELHIYYRIVDY